METSQLFRQFDSGLDKVLGMTEEPELQDVSESGVFCRVSPFLGGGGSSLRLGLVTFFFVTCSLILLFRSHCTCDASQLDTTVNRPTLEYRVPPGCLTPYVVASALFPMQLHSSYIHVACVAPLSPPARFWIAASIKKKSDVTMPERVHA